MPLRALRLDVVDAVRSRHRALDRSSDKSPNEFGVSADVNRGHRDRGDVAARVLPHIQRLHRLQTGDEDDKANHHRQHRPFDKQIGKFHFLIRVRSSHLLALTVVVSDLDIDGSDLLLRIDRPGVQLRLGGQIVIDYHRHSVTQLEHAGADHHIACFQPFRNGNEISTRFPDPHKSLS